MFTNPTQPLSKDLASAQASLSKTRVYHQSQTSTLDEKLILVDDQDNEIGILDKKTCHLNSYNVNGHPHRAFSLFLFNRNNELLLHKRSKLKIAFPSAWTNSCCSHPKVLEFNAEGFKPEPVENGVVRRTIFELGIDLTGQKLCHVDKILYRSPYDEEWGEHEVDYVFFCKVDADVAVKHNPDEIDEYKWVSKNELLPFMKDVEEKGGHMTPWFKKIYHSNKLIEWWETLINEGIEALSHLKPNSVRSFK